MIGGEGRFDSQSLEGKIVGEIAERCAAAGKPLHLIIGEDALEGEAPGAISTVAAAATLAEIRRRGLESASGR